MAPPARVTLDRLTRRQCAAFCAAAAERLWPAYDELPGQHQGHDVVRSSLDLLWRFAQDGSVDEAVLRDQVAAMYRLVPTQDDVWGPHRSQLDDALAASIYAAESVLGDPVRSAKRVRQRAQDFADLIDEAVPADDFAEDEKVRQLRDLAAISEASEDELAARCASLKSRCRAEGRELVAIIRDPSSYRPRTRARTLDHDDTSGQMTFF